MAVSRAFSLTGLQKLGQPVPDSNLLLASKSLAPQQTQTNVPLKWPLAYLPEKGCSVAFIRVTMNCSGVSSFRHSSLVLNIRSGSLAALLEPLDDSPRSRNPAQFRTDPAPGPPYSPKRCRTRPPGAGQNDRTEIVSSFRFLKNEPRTYQYAGKSLSCCFDFRFLAWRRSELGLAGFECRFEQAFGDGRCEALDHGHVPPAAFDDLADVVAAAPERVGNSLGLACVLAHPPGLVAGIGLGELPGVILAVPGRQPDQAELLRGALEYRVAVAIPT